MGRERYATESFFIVLIATVIGGMAVHAVIITYTAGNADAWLNFQAFEFGKLTGAIMTVVVVWIAGWNSE